MKIETLNPTRVNITNKKTGEIVGLVDILNEYFSGSDYKVSLVREADERLNFTKCLVHARSKGKDGKEYINFYILEKEDAKAIQIKLAFYDPKLFKYLLAISDKGVAYTEKKTSVFVPKDDEPKGE